MEISIGQDQFGFPVISVKGNNPDKVAKTYLKVRRLILPNIRDLIKRKKEGKTK